MPKKSKPIDVGSGSMNGLKNLLAQKTDTGKNNGTEKECHKEKESQKTR